MKADLVRIKEKIVEQIDSLINLVENKFGDVALGPKPHARLKIFMEEYEKVFGVKYQVSNYSMEGGAAKQTEFRVARDSEYLAAVQAYLSDRKRALGFSFMKFIAEFPRWVAAANQGGKNA